MYLTNLEEANVYEPQYLNRSEIVTRDFLPLQNNGMCEFMTHTSVIIDGFLVYDRNYNVIMEGLFDQQWHLLAGSIFQANVQIRWDTRVVEPNMIISEYGMYWVKFFKLNPPNRAVYRRPLKKRFSSKRQKTWYKNGF